MMLLVALHANGEPVAGKQAPSVPATTKASAEKVKDDTPAAASEPAEPEKVQVPSEAKADAGTAAAVATDKPEIKTPETKAASQATSPQEPASTSASISSPASAQPAATQPAAQAATRTAHSRLPARTSQPLTVEDFNRLSAANQRRIQQALFEIYKGQPEFMKEYDWNGNPLSDSIVGPITLSWLNRFLKDFRIEAPRGQLSDDTIEALVHFAAIAKVYPDWKSTLLSDDLARWIDRKPQPLRSELYRMRLSGSAQQVIALLNMYRTDGAPTGRANLTESWRNWVIHTYRLDEADLKTLAAKGKAVAELAVLQEETYVNRQLLSNAVRDALKESAPGQDQWLLPVVEQYARIEDPDAPGQFSYAITGDVLQQVQADPRMTTLPAPVITMLQNLQGIDYPRQDLFDKAVRATLGDGIGVCPLNRSDYQRTQLPDHALPAETFAGLKDTLPSDLYATLDKYRTLTTPCSDAQLKEAAAAVDKVDAMYQPSIESQARKTPLFDPAVPVDWNGGNCGCVLDELAGTVYGFYPFWLAGGKQQLDFSLLSRAGYVGLSFDERGNLVHLNERPDGERADGMLDTQFVAAAHKHRTRVDWVLYKHDWNVWASLGEAERRRGFDALADNVASFLNTRLTDPVSRIIPYLSLGATAPVQGDGVTLYFDNYPTDTQSVTLFEQFIDRLLSKLGSKQQSHGINLLLPRSAMLAGKGIYTPEHLVSLIDRIAGTEPEGWSWSTAQIRSRPHFLVFLEEPTSESKKQLRLDIENALHGAAREKLLRQIVPVIEFDGRSWQQLEDDVIYLKDNFGGIGLWPLSYRNATAAADAAAPTNSVDQTLLQHYLKPGGDPDLLVCRIVCPNRWLFRTAWNVSFGIALLIGGLYLWNCRCRAAIERRYLLYLLAAVVPPFALGMPLLSCDPYLEQISRGNWPFIGLFALMLGFVAWRYMNRKMNASKP
ncbi:hypothetical protein [Oxalicibacterium solurbis]|nr:hypothetical protein [Oxalicibacterium solurbis]